MMCITSILSECMQSLKKEFEHKRFHWELVEEIERPRVVNARVAPFQTKENLFAQVVIRLHTQQVLYFYKRSVIINIGI